MNKRVAGVVGLGLVLASTGVFAVQSYAGLTIDVSGIADAAMAIGTSMLGVMAVFWGVRKVLSLVG